MIKFMHVPSFRENVSVIIYGSAYNMLMIALDIIFPVFQSMFLLYTSFINKLL